MAQFEFAGAALLGIEVFLDVVELRPKKLSGARRLACADIGVLVHVERSEDVGHARPRLRIATDIADRERDHRSARGDLRITASEIQVDVASHLLDDVVKRHAFLPQVRVQIELRDEIRQPDSAHDFLSDRLNPR